MSDPRHSAASEHREKGELVNSNCDFAYTAGKVSDPIPSLPDPFHLVGTAIEGRYRVDAVIGEGGFGVVYRGWHLAFRHTIAIKCLKTPTHYSAEAKAAFLDRFREEGALLSRLSQHPAIVRAYDFGVATSRGIEAIPYMVLEWLDGETLEDWFQRQHGAAMDERAALLLLRGAFEGLAFAHSQQPAVAHRDIKPPNLFLTVDPVRGAAIKILDFGISKAMLEGARISELKSRTSSGFSAFTPSYGAPEQFSSKKFGETSPRTDVHALGLILCEAVTGRRALDGDDLLELQLSGTSTQRPTPRARGATVSDAFEAACAKALALNPRDRFATSAEMLGALDAIPVDSQVRAPSAQPIATERAELISRPQGQESPGRSAKPDNRSRRTSTGRAGTILAALAGVGLLAGVIGIVILTFRDAETPVVISSGDSATVPPPAPSSATAVAPIPTPNPTTKPSVKEAPSASPIPTPTPPPLEPEHMCVVKDGYVYCWGSNEMGQLGDGTTSSFQQSPVRVRTLDDVTLVALGRANTCGLVNDDVWTKRNGTWCWGSNQYKQLATDETPFSSVPVQSPHVRWPTYPDRHLAVGGNHACMTQESGSYVSCWGDNREGQLGSIRGSPRASPLHVEGLPNIKAIALGGAHTCAVLEGSTVRCWGSNEFGQIGESNLGGSTASPVLIPGFGYTQLALGEAHSCALRNDVVSCWGRNAWGQLGDGTTTDRASPRDVQLMDIDEIRAGIGHTCARTRTGSVWCWGLNDKGQLGDGTVETQTRPVRASKVDVAIQLSLHGRTSCALRQADAKWRCWGLREQDWF